MINYVYRSRNSDLDWIITIIGSNYCELRLLSDFGFDPFASSRIQIEEIIKKTSPLYSESIEDSRTLSLIINKDKVNSTSDINKIEKFIISYVRNNTIEKIIN